MAALATTPFLALLLIAATLPAPAATFEEGLEQYDAAVAAQVLDHEGYARAYEIWQPLAEQGHAGAQYHVGMLHYFGLGGAEFDQYRAFELFTAAAGNGYPPAQSFLGVMAEHGDGTYTRVSPELALRWYRKGAEGGHCPSVRRLAAAYEKGELGLQPDTGEAAKWRGRIEGCRRR